MNILIASHSACHDRQMFFYRELSKYLSNTVIIGPKRWGQLKLLNSTEQGFITRGLVTSNERNLEAFQFLGLDLTVQLSLNLFLGTHKKFDIFLVQEEWWSRATTDLFALANRIGAKKVLFTWENIRTPNIKEIETIKQADAIICGNDDAKQIIKGCDYPGFIFRFPQVGINTELFCPLTEEKTYDLVFCGRPVPEKGFPIIEKIAKIQGWKLAVAYNQPYPNLPVLLNQARISVSLPQDTPHWKEQSGGYSSLEALSCGIPIITTNCGAIPEYIPKEIGIILPQGRDIEQVFPKAVEKLLHSELAEIGLKGRIFITNNYSNQTIAKQTAEMLESLL